MDTSHTPKVTASDICDALGRKAMSERLGVGLTAISQACVEGKFSARWFKIVRSMCSDAGIECPDHLFSFIADESSPLTKAS